MASYVNTTISLNKEDLKLVEKLKKRGHTIIGIFRAGLKDIEARTPKKLF